VERSATVASETKLEGAAMRGSFGRQSLFVKSK